MTEGRFVAWAGVLLAAAALVASLLLPGSQAWLCRSGLRLACDAGGTVIESVTLRHQHIPGSADATMLLDVLASRLSFEGMAARPVACDEVDPYLADYETRYRATGQGSGLVRGEHDFVMADIELRYPASDVAFTQDVVITLQVPKREPAMGGFGLDPGPVVQRVSLQSRAGAGSCRASFLLARGPGTDTLATASWPPGNYVADIRLGGGVTAHRRVQFTLP